MFILRNVPKEISEELECSQDDIMTENFIKGLT
jgi:hypothetical protein